MSNPCSKDVPQLLTSHFDHLRQSAISVEVIKARGYKTAMGKQVLKEAGFSKAQQRAPGILIPLYGVTGSTIGYQYRPDHPRDDKRRGRPIKYENPVGASVRLDVPPACTDKLKDPKKPLWFTEGIKKVDSLASVGVCAVGLTGVWGFKGKNLLGGTTVLADFDYIALKGRECYLAFDSDYSSNPQVKQALNRLAEHLKRKGAIIHFLQLPDDGEHKMGVDDYLAAGHTIEDIKKLETKQEDHKASLRERTGDQYCIESNHICWVKQTINGEVIVPLCNFNAKIIEVVSRDNGLDISKAFKIEGIDGHGIKLPEVEVSTASFESMSWVTAEWDTRAIISANQTAKNKLREAMMLQSQDGLRRNIFSHTGWRDIDGDRVFLTASGATGGDGVDVELEDDFVHYSLPQPVDDPTEAVAASYDFLNIGSFKVTLPLWSAMFLSPLSELLDPAFTLFICGHSGSFKSTLTALALNHFGEKFDEFHLPAAWRDTENKLEKLLFLAKDLPLVIDDWAPGQDSAKARELEVKAEHVIRAQGNRQGKGRLRSDTSSRKTYIPRGMLITSGEQLPGGHSHTARMFSVEIESSDINLEKMSEAQNRKYLYSIAMTHYILWLKKNWPDLSKTLKGQHKVWRDQAMSEGCHPRLPATVSWLYAGLAAALEFINDSGCITDQEAEDMSKKGWKMLIQLSSEQGFRVEEERPGKRFMEALTALIDQGRVVFWPKDDEMPRKAIPGETCIGWSDLNGYYLLNPPAAYSAIHEFCGRSGSPFTFKEKAVWKDLKRLGYTETSDGRYTYPEKIYGSLKRIIKVKKGMLRVADGSNIALF